MAGTQAILVAIILAGSMWAIVFALISRLSGWGSLAAQYRFSEPFSGSRWNWQSAQWRWLMGYNNCLTVGADARGLYLAMLLPFRIAHPPLFIPWREISVSPKRIFGFKIMELRLGYELSIPMRINNRLAEKLRAAAGASWPIESIAESRHC